MTTIEALEVAIAGKTRAHGGHLVQFYEDDAFLTNALTRFIGRALDNEQVEVTAKIAVLRSGRTAQLPHSLP